MAARTASPPIQPRSVGPSVVVPSPLPPHVVDEVLDLLADAILADLRAHPDARTGPSATASIRAVPRVTVAPPRGSVRSRAYDKKHGPGVVGQTPAEEQA
jgi:hypothetical protein